MAMESFPVFAIIVMGVFLLRGIRCGEDCNETCINGTCYHNETCIEGCLNGFHGQNCSLPCPSRCTNSTCERVTGGCSFGCEGDFFGDRCEKSCGPNCADDPGNEAGTICNTTTLNCLYGCKDNFGGNKCDTCKRGWTGDQCQLVCDYNCQECTWKSGTHYTGCDLCYPQYYNDEQSKRCSPCRVTCLKNSSSTLPTCDQVDGNCTFGCTSNWGGEQCNRQCVPWCATTVCYGKDACCTDGCKYKTYGGCECNEPCSTDCVDGTCFQNKTCINGCKLNYWGDYCNETCSWRCAEGPDNSSSLCDRDGACVFGCKKTFSGRDCSDDCAMSCPEKDCNKTTGHCLQGCQKKIWGDRCENNCSTNCVQADCNDKDATCRLGCLTGLHGSLCTEKCPENCINSTCFRQNGTCSIGCLEGFTGGNCDTLAGYTAVEYAMNIDAVIAGLIVGGLVLVCCVCVLLFLTYRNCQYKRAKKLELDTSDRLEQSKKSTTYYNIPGNQVQAQTLSHDPANRNGPNGEQTLNDYEELKERSDDQPYERMQLE